MASSSVVVNGPRRALVEAAFDGTPSQVNRRALESGESTVVFQEDGKWFSQRGA